MEIVGKSFEWYEVAGAWKGRSCNADAKTDIPADQEEMAAQTLVQGQCEEGQAGRINKKL